jgi:hypothetical protein
LTQTSRGGGRCLCGAVTYRVTGLLRDVYNCHCHRCRRFTGHHMAATAADVTEVSIHDSAGTLDPPTGLATVQAWWTREASDYHERPAVTEFPYE